MQTRNGCLITVAAAVHAVAVEVANFISTAITTSCWHTERWHQLATTVRQEGLCVCFSCHLSKGCARSRIRFTPEIKEFDKKVTGSLNSLLRVSVNLSHLLIKAVHKRREA